MVKVLAELRTRASRVRHLGHREEVKKTRLLDHPQSVGPGEDFVHMAVSRLDL